MDCLYVSEAHRRSKQPAQVRAQLLQVAAELIVRDGYESLTLDKVAKQAGVSKGGLQYHFASKAVLLRALCDSMKEVFETIFNEALAQEPEGPRRVTRAYIRVCFAEVDPLITKAMFILTLALPDFAREQGEWLHSLCEIDARCAPELAPILQLYRFAADGLWIAETSGVLRFDEEKRAALLNRLLALTDAL